MKKISNNTKTILYFLIHNFEYINFGFKTRLRHARYKNGKALVWPLKLLAIDVRHTWHFSSMMWIRIWIRSDPHSFGSVDPDPGIKWREKQSLTNKSSFFRRKLYFSGVFSLMIAYLWGLDSDFFFTLKMWFYWPGSGSE